MKPILPHPAPAVLGLLLISGYSYGQAKAAKPPVTAPTAWATFTSKNAGFSVTLPGKPSSEKDNQTDETGSRTMAETVSSEKEGGWLYFALVMRLNPTAVEQIQASQPGGITLQQFMMSQIVTKNPFPKDLLKSKKPLTWNGLTGEEWTFSGKGKDGKPHWGQMRAVSNKDTVVVLFAGDTGTPTPAVTTNVSRFFASFRLLAPPAELLNPPAPPAVQVPAVDPPTPPVTPPPPETVPPVVPPPAVPPPPPRQ